MTYIQTKELPYEITSVLSRLGYNKKDIDVEAHEKVSPASSSSDGCRSFMAIINLSTGEYTEKWGSYGGANIFNRDNQVDNDTSSYTIPENFCVIKGSSGGNRPVLARLIVRSDMIAKFLPQKAELNPRLQYILDVYATYNSSGREREFNDYGHIPPSKEELNELVRLGLIKINKAGSVSVTTEGKNMRKAKNGWVTYVGP